jgi:hypothetical protein
VFVVLYMYVIRSSFNILSAVGIEVAEGLINIGYLDTRTQKFQMFVNVVIQFWTLEILPY